ncbi:MAG: DUF2945 domain-containing protein [Cyanobacteria bacterium J06600_6]
MTQQFKQGDGVEWNSGSGKATGEVIKKITEPTEIDEKKIQAAEDIALCKLVKYNSSNE